MCDIINQQHHLNQDLTTNKNCLNTSMTTQQMLTTATYSMFVKKSIDAKTTFANQTEREQEEEEEEINIFQQDTQDTSIQMMSDISTVDEEEENKLQHIASEILKEKRTYYYQVKKQIVKKLSLGTRQTENTKQKRWCQTEEIQFWVLLGKFGTNFEFTAKEIKTKTRKQVMLKFNREDKKDATLVDQALKGQLPSFIQAIIPQDQQQ